MNLRSFICIALITILFGNIYAKPVDETTARTIASHFYAMKFNHPTETLTPTIAYTATAIRGENSVTPSFYVVNFNSEGFVIVSGDDRAQPILAFSDEGAFVSENIPAHIQFFLDGYTEGIKYIVDNNQENDAFIQRQWDELLSETPHSPKDGDVVVGPLLGDNKWNQTKYYNDLCPADATGNTVYGGHVPVGCGALVMGQVIRYWRFPTTGNGSHSYSSNYGTLSVNFGATTYHYENMPDRLTSISHPDSCVEAIATLLYHCGVSVNMRYGASASVSNSNNIVASLSTYFRYPSTIQYIEKGSLASSTWLGYLKGELDEGAPFMYGGSGDYGGHVWTCDGYRDDDYFHFNWGWGGQQNGYFALTSCSSYGFNSNHAIIIGIRGPELPENIEELSSKNINLYPNPANDILNITSSETISEIEIVNANGQVVKHVEVNADNVTCNVEDLTRGMYVIRIYTNPLTKSREPIVRKFVKK